MENFNQLLNLANQALFADNLPQSLSDIDAEIKDMYLNGQQLQLRQKLSSKQAFADTVEIVNL